MRAGPMGDQHRRSPACVRPRAACMSGICSERKGDCGHRRRSSLIRLSQLGCELRRHWPRAQGVMQQGE